MPVTSWSDGDVVDATELNQIEDQLVVTCTSTTRPTNKDGRHIAETDTNLRYVGDGTSWHLIGSTEGWETFTPSWTNFSLGNGTTDVARFTYGSGAMHVVVQVTLGSTSSVSGAVRLTIPNGESIVYGNSYLTYGRAKLREDGVATRLGNVTYFSTTAVSITAESASSSYVRDVSLSSTVPFTWGTSDAIGAVFSVPVA